MNDQILIKLLNFYNLRCESFENKLNQNQNQVKGQEFISLIKLEIENLLHFEINYDNNNHSKIQTTETLINLDNHFHKESIEITFLRIIQTFLICLIFNFYFIIINLFIWSELIITKLFYTSLNLLKSFNPKQQNSSQISNLNHNHDVIRGSNKLLRSSSNHNNNILSSIMKLHNNDSNPNKIIRNVSWESVKHDNHTSNLNDLEKQKIHKILPKSPNPTISYKSSNFNKKMKSKPKLNAINYRLPNKIDQSNQILTDEEKQEEGQEVSMLINSEDEEGQGVNMLINNEENEGEEEEGSDTSPKDIILPITPFILRDSSPSMNEPIELIREKSDDQLKC
ncbi:hypothetical protein CROQUDRAFT_135208 [Cronartium quercuum f. sp. fusiforme G11]|uniref:Uncharacterized protein n=1 Tax=Cronartium quercuum f. sp. fusiforme G11 TaxID=708437 RepID=A0A9P6NAL5_9BASI|nr:hypothetical protein CROQUDRAFT_135208 [Cronartium quercuum f. sp. fusiforme G11]